VYFFTTIQIAFVIIMKDFFKKNFLKKIVISFCFLHTIFVINFKEKKRRKKT